MVNSLKLVSMSLFILCLLGCNLNQKLKEQKENENQVPFSTFSLSPSDWIVQSKTLNRSEITERTLKSEKLEYVRKNFSSPVLSPISVPESNGFEVYEVQGHSDWHNALYIHPKIYVNSGTAQGSILGYRLGEVDPNGDDLIEVSIPVALVDGLVPSIPLPGGPLSGAGAAVSLSEKYQIPNPDQLKARVGKEIRTLPVCPTLFRLTFENKEYWSSNRDFDCTPNQFFRIRFRAPMADMKRMLETAAVRDETVNLIADLSVEMRVPRKTVEVRVSPDQFEAALKQKLAKLEPKTERKAMPAISYASSELEDAVVDTLFELGKTLELDVRDGSGIQSRVRPLIVNYFTEPFRCPSGANCRSWLKSKRQKGPIEFSWQEEEPLSTPLTTQTISSLGAVANATQFLSRPSLDQLSLVRRPSLFQARTFADVQNECQRYAIQKFSVLPNTSPDEMESIKLYCQVILDQFRPSLGENAQGDGYYPLGSNTVVYPGAWLKVDIDDISELTTARTKTMPDGRQIIESKVIDLLSPEINSTGPLATCIEGSDVACEEYETFRHDYRDAAGNPVLGPCEKGTPDCICRAEGGGEVCQRGWYPILSYECPAEALHSYCPYWRSQEDVVDFDYEYTCHLEETSSSSLLGLLGSSKSTHTVCKETKKTAVTKTRSHLNCIEDDPKGIVHREQYCEKPKYRCRKWRQNCTRYSVNEVFQVDHEEKMPKWRPFAIEKGEYPKRFEEDIYLKFVSPNRTVSQCKLSLFPRELRGNSFFIKIPSEENDVQPCDHPIWEKGINTNPLHYPKVYIKNAISYPERRLCGRTEYSFLTKAIPQSGTSALVPERFSAQTEVHIGPVENSCRAENPFRIGSDLWFTEYPPIRFSGRVSVLGRVLESLVTETKP